MANHVDDDFSICSLHHLNAAVIRIGFEQTKREALLSDAEALTSYASDKGISAREMEHLLQTNHTAAASYLSDLTRYLASDEAIQRRCLEQTRAESIRFKDLADAPITAEFQDGWVDKFHVTLSTDETENSEVRMFR